MTKFKFFFYTKFKFGKHKGRSVRSVIKTDWSYLKWLYDNNKVTFDESVVKYLKVSQEAPIEVTEEEINPKVVLMKRYNCKTYYDLKQLLGKDLIEKKLAEFKVL